MSGGGSSGGGGQSSTVTQVQQIPEWQKDYAIKNEEIAAALATRDYPTYEGQTIAGFAPAQEQGMQMTQTAATAQQPYYNQAGNAISNVANQNWNANTAQQYMNPYAMAALAPQMQQLGLMQAQQAKNINAGATQSGAFGDARTGVQQGMNDFYGNLAMNDLVSQGMNAAYNTGQQAYLQDAAKQLQAGSQMMDLGTAAQTAGLEGANAVFNTGTQQQQLNQQQLTAAYNNFLNQVNWPAEMLNLRISALANTPYSVTNYQSLAPTNATAQNIGTFATLAGGLGSLFGGNSGSSRGGVFGGN